ncbi:GNAT family N-acetyltransferase, partial [Streptomyces anthocyanicus]
MDHTAVLALFDRDMRENARPFGPGSVVERVGGVVRHVGSERGWNGVLWSDLTEADADAAITEQRRHFAQLGREFEWKLYGHDRPRDLGQRLLAAGFTPEPAETLMIIEAGELDLDAEPPPGVALRTVTDAAGVDLMVDVHEQAFGTPGTALRHQLLALLDEAPDTVV